MTEAVTTLSLSSLLACEQYAMGLDLTQAKRTLHQRMGGYSLSIRGRGIDVSDVRAYQTGDDIRAMNWKVTARMGFAHIKQFEQERERPVLCCVDLTRSMRFATRVAFKSIIAAKIAAILAWVAYKQRDKIGGVIFKGNETDIVLPQPKEKGLFSLFHALEQETPDRKPSKSGYLDQALRQTMNIAPSGSLVFVISDFYDYQASSQHALLQLSQRCDVIAIAVYDPVEIKAPPPNTYFIKNEHNQIDSMKTYDPQFRDQYETCFQLKRNILKTNLNNAQIPLLSVMTNQSLTQILQAAFANYVDVTEFSDASRTC